MIQSLPYGSRQSVSNHLTTDTQAHLPARQRAVARDLRGGGRELPDVQILRPGRFHGAVPLPARPSQSLDDGPVGGGRTPGAAVLIAASLLSGRSQIRRRHTAPCYRQAAAVRRRMRSRQAPPLSDGPVWSHPLPIALATPVAPLQWPDPSGATAASARPATPAPLCYMNSCPGANR
jgi:hypothetical protein